MKVFLLIIAIYCILRILDFIYRLSANDTIKQLKPWLMALYVLLFTIIGYTAIQLFIKISYGNPCFP
jgi:hypothetical protein